MNRAAVAEQVLGSMPEPVAHGTRRILSTPVPNSFLAPADVAVMAAADPTPLHEESAGAFRRLLARVGAAVCLSRLGLPPIATDDDVHARALRFLTGALPLPRIRSGDGSAEAWLRRERAWAELGQRRNAVMARACAFLSAEPRPRQATHPPWDLVDVVDLAVGAAGGYEFSAAAITALRRAIDDNLVRL
jgi:hypothetical protein